VQLTEIINYYFRLVAPKGLDQEADADEQKAGKKKENGGKSDSDDD
jgi:hypothetical protein